MIRVEVRVGERVATHKDRNTDIQKTKVLFELRVGALPMQWNSVNGGYLSVVDNWCEDRNPVRMSS